MAKYRYRLIDFLPFDYIGVERYLEKMAAKGLRLVSAETILWKFEKAEPAKVTYAVTYAPDSSIFDPAPTASQRNMEEFCAEYGWTKVGNWGKMEIFCSEEAAPVPLETDEIMRLHIITQSMKKTFLLAHVAALATFLLNGFTTLSNFRTFPVEKLSDPGFLSSAGVLLWGGLVTLIIIAYYFLWKSRARKLVYAGGCCPEPVFYRYFSRIVWTVLIVLCILWFKYAGLKYIGFTGAYLIGFALMLFISLRLRFWMKKKGVSRGKNMAISFAVIVVLSFTLVISLVTGAVIYYTREDRVATGKTYEYNGRIVEIEEDVLPLYVEDLLETNYKHYSCIASESSSFLVSYGGYVQRSFNDGQNAPTLEYHVVNVKADLFFDLCLNDYLDKGSYAWDGSRRFRSVEDAEWQADEVYRYIIDNEAANTWVVVFGNNILYVESDWALTAEQKSIIAEKLALL